MLTLLDTLIQVLNTLRLVFPFARRYPESDTASARLSEAGFFCAIFRVDVRTILAKTFAAPIGGDLSSRLCGQRRYARALWLARAVSGCHAGNGL